MHVGLRLLFAFVAITGLAAFFVLRVFVTEIKPSVREVMEDLMVDTANLLAEVAAPEMAALPAGGVLAQGGDGGEGALSSAVRAYATRPMDARISGLHKTSLDLRVLMTDAGGRVVFDSGTPSATGQDYSRWRDVLLTLRGEYGARTSRARDDPQSSVMFVAAPVRAGGRTIGTVVIAKPLSTIEPFVQRAERKVLWAGVLLLGLSLTIGVVVTLWTVASVRKLRRYALEVGELAGAGAVRLPPPAPPALAGELGELARAMDQMRQRLDSREQLEHHVRALTHELKSPLAAIRGAAELLQDELSAPDRQRFVQQVDEQSLRLQNIVEQMLELSKLESLRQPPSPELLDLVELTGAVLDQHAAALQQRRLQPRWLQQSAAPVHGDRAQLMLAISNVLANAIRHAPAGSTLDFALAAPPSGVVRWSLRDHGEGVADYALPQLGTRFFSTAAAHATTRGSGLGLAIVQQVLWLHRGELRFEAAAPGLRVIFSLPAA
jgi:two-component system sensor histidine kinase CreC